MVCYVTGIHDYCKEYLCDAHFDEYNKYHHDNKNKQMDSNGFFWCMTI